MGVRLKGRIIGGHRAEVFDIGKQIFIRIPAISSQFLGSGKTMSDAVKEVKESLRFIRKKNAGRRK